MPNLEHLIKLFTFLHFVPLNNEQIRASNCNHNADLLKDCQKRAKEWEKAVELAEKAATLEKENMEANMSNLQSILIEKDGLIEFLTFETEEKKKQLEESAKVISNEQKYVVNYSYYSKHLGAPVTKKCDVNFSALIPFLTLNLFRESAKIKDKLATCEQVIVQQKEKNKQSRLQRYSDRQANKFVEPVRIEKSDDEYEEDESMEEEGEKFDRLQPNSEDRELALDWRMCPKDKHHYL